MVKKDKRMKSSNQKTLLTEIIRLEPVQNYQSVVFFFAPKNIRIYDHILLDETRYTYYTLSYHSWNAGTRIRKK